MRIQELHEIASHVRHGFESQSIDRDLLWARYCMWNPAALEDDKERFLGLAAESFPVGNCGLASAYLLEEVDIDDGQVRRVSYMGQDHTILIGKIAMIDITADQFGGPRIYIGPMVEPWVELN